MKIFSSGVDGDTLYYSMELLEGCDLGMVLEKLETHSHNHADLETWRIAVTTAVAKNRSQEEPLDDGVRLETFRVNGVETASAKSGRKPEQSYAVDHVIELIAQVADACQTLHEAGVVHRDIKPGNIMVSVDGIRAALMDLGIARMLDESEGRLTRTTHFVGTLRYASPEQIYCANDIDRRTDIYSLGATLWELLTWRPMFGATDEMSDLDLRNHITADNVESPRKYNRRVPKDVCSIVAKCLAKDRGRRYHSAAELGDDLRRYLRREAVLAQPPSLIYSVSKIARRNIPALVISTVVILALLTLAIGFLAAVRQSGLRDRQALAEKNRVLAINHLTLGAGRLDAGRDALGMHSLLSAYELSTDDDQLREAIRTSIRYRLNDLPIPIPSLERVRRVEFSGDSKILATCGNSSISLWNADTGWPIPDLATRIESASSQWEGIPAALNHDGSLLAYENSPFDSPTEIRIVRVPSLEDYRSLSLDKGPSSIMFVPGGKALNLVLNGGVSQWSFKQGDSVKTLVPGPGIFYFSADRKHVTRKNGEELTLFDTATGQQVGNSITRMNTNACVTGDSQNVICLSDDSISHWNPTRQTMGEIGTIGVKNVFYNETMREMTIWTNDFFLRYDLRKIAWPRAVGLPPALDEPNLFVAPDGKHAVMTDMDATLNRIELIDLTPGQAIPVLLEGTISEGEIIGAGFSYDGRHCAVVTKAANPGDVGADSNGDMALNCWDTLAGIKVRLSELEYNRLGLTATIPDERIKIRDPIPESMWNPKQTRGLNDVRTSLDGTTVAISGRTATHAYGLIVRTREGGTLLKKQFANQFTTGLSGDGSTIAILLSGQCRVWRMSQDHMELDVGRGYRELAINAEGNRIALLSVRGGAFLADISGKSLTMSPLDHASPVTFLGVSKDQKSFITGTRDGLVAVWDFESQTRVMRPRKMQGPIKFAAIDDHHRHLVVFSRTGEGSVWHLEPDQADSIAELRIAAERMTLTQSVGGVPVPIQSSDWSRLYDWKKTVNTDERDSKN